jgi:hypothetical protein
MEALVDVFQLTAKTAITVERQRKKKSAQHRRHVRDCSTHLLGASGVEYTATALKSRKNQAGPHSSFTGSSRVEPTMTGTELTGRGRSGNRGRGRNLHKGIKSQLKPPAVSFLP